MDQYQLSKEVGSDLNGLSSSEYEQRVLRVKAEPQDDDLFAELVRGTSAKQRACLVAQRLRAMNRLLRQEARSVAQADRLESDRQKAEAAKKKQRVRRKGEHAGRTFVDDLALAHPGDIKSQLMKLLAVPRLASMGTVREVSERTQTEYRRSLQLLFRYLEADSLLPNNLKELGRVHVLHAIKRGVQRGFSNAYMQNFISRIRRFFIWMGRSEVVPSTLEIEKLLGLTANDSQGIQAFRRNHVAERPLSWEANGVQVEDVLMDVGQYCPHTALLLEMQAAFGLRVKESLMLRPAHALEDGCLHVVRGTKGGRQRSMPLESGDMAVRDWQLDVIERAKAAAAKNRSGDLGYIGMSLRQSLRRYYYVAEKHGITRKNLGVTSHGLRHQYVARRYLDLMGTPPPVEGLTRPTTPEFMAEDLQARLKISEELGHSRASITNGYCGSSSKVRQQSARLLKKLVGDTAENEKFHLVLNEFAVRRCWVGGALGAGLVPRLGEPVQFYLEFEPRSAAFDVHDTMRLNRALEGAVRNRVMFSILAFGMEPDVEVIEVTPRSKSV